MDVVRKREMQVFFSDLNVGETFLWDNKAFVKTEPTCRASNAMDLSYDRPACFCPDDSVQRAKFKLVEV